MPRLKKDIHEERFEFIIAALQLHNSQVEASVALSDLFSNYLGRLLAKENVFLEIT